MKSFHLLTAKDGDGKKILDWWLTLQDHRGERAQLRRADTPDDILLTPAFIQFLRRMPEHWGVDFGEEGIFLRHAALIAAVLAHVKEHSDQFSFAERLARPRETGGKAVMSELRFQRLQKSRTEDEFFTRIRRAVGLLRGEVNIISLTNDILHWLHEYHFAPADRPERRLAVKWASEYYSVYKDEQKL